MNVTNFITPDQVGRALTLCWVASGIARKMGLPLQVPVCIVGDTGCGKTTAVRAFHKYIEELVHKEDKKAKVGLYLQILSYSEATDLGGFPSPDHKSRTVEYLMMNTLPFDTNETAIVFGDEFDRSTPEVQNAFLQVLLGGEFHGHKLSPNAFPVLAMNGTADIYTTPLSKAARTRFCSLFVSRHAATGRESYEKWASDNDIPVAVRAFHRWHGDKILSTTTFEELAECTPRTLDMCGVVTKARKMVEDSNWFQVDDVYYPVLAGLIGQVAATAYMQVEKAIADGVKPESVLESPDKADVPENGDSIYFLLETVAGIIKQKEVRTSLVKKAFAYALRLKNEEWTAMWADRLIGLDKSLGSDPAYAKWYNKKRGK